MSTAIEHLVQQFESRRLSRRELVATLSAMVAAAGSSASAQTPAAPNVSLLAQGRSLNHASLAVTDVEKAAAFYGTLLGAKIVSRPGNGGINLGLGDGFLGLYKLANPGTVNHICVGVDNFDADRLAAKCKEMGITARVSRNPAASTKGEPQLYVQAFDNHNLQLSEHGYQG